MQDGVVARHMDAAPRIHVLTALAFVLAGEGCKAGRHSRDQQNQEASARREKEFEARAHAESCRAHRDPRRQHRHGCSQSEDAQAARARVQ